MENISLSTAQSTKNAKFAAKHNIYLTENSAFSLNEEHAVYTADIRSVTPVLNTLFTPLIQQLQIRFGPDQGTEHRTAREAHSRVSNQTTTGLTQHFPWLSAGDREIPLTLDTTFGARFNQTTPILPISQTLILILSYEKSIKQLLSWLII